MPYVDYFCPMVYPSHYGPGVFGHAVPNAAPYDVIDKTLEIMNEQKAGLPVVIRPWIQDFGYGPFPPYTADQVLAEMQAARDNDARGWMIWNARAIFTEAALAGPREGEDAGTVTVDLRHPRPPHPASPGAAASPSGLDRCASSSSGSHGRRCARGIELLGEIGRGAVVLTGIGIDDKTEIADRMADKLIGLRYFADADGRTNLAIADVGGAFLVVSQFTLYADVSRGRRPGFTASPAGARDPARRPLQRPSARGGRAGPDRAVRRGNAGRSRERRAIHARPGLRARPA